MRFLSLSTYPCGMPRHGGQARVNALHLQLQAAGWQTRQFAVCPYGAYGEAAREDGVIEMTAEYTAAIEARRGRTDVSSSDFLLTDPGRYLERLFDLVHSFKPDVISVEQAWLWPALKEYFATFRNRQRYAVVYSSHNVEHALLATEATLHPHGTAASELERARAIEDELAREADGVIVVSETDARYFRRLNDRVLVAPNGIAAFAEPGGLDYWTRTLAPYRRALFVGSYHPPNASGFNTCLLHPTLAYLAPDETIVIAGGVGALLQQRGMFRKHLGANLARTQMVGVQNEGGLASLYHLAHVVLLPIVEGGGTNIKTAEALRGRRRIVATATAMRGYDEFLDTPGLTVVDDPKDFPQAMKAALWDDRPLRFDKACSARLDKLLWQHTLFDVPEFIAKVANRRDIAVAAGRFAPRRGLDGFLGEGWYHSEPDGVWTTGPRATLLFAFDWQNADTAAMKLGLSGFPHPDALQFVAVRHNDEVLGYASFVEKDVMQEVTITLRRPADLGNGDTELEIVASSAATPAELFGSDDRRVLGVRLHWLELSRSP